MLKKPNLSADAKTRLKNEILNAIDGEKKLSPPAGFSVKKIAEKDPPADLPEVKPAVEAEITKPAAEKVAIKKIAIPEETEKIDEQKITEKEKPQADESAKPIIKIEKKEAKKHSRKQPGSFVLIPEIKLKVKNRQEKHHPNQGLSMLRFIIFLLIIIVALLVANLFMLAR